MRLITEPYTITATSLPKQGNHIVAHYDEEYIVVYQAMPRTIRDFAVENGYFGGDDFLLHRMSWIKPSFTWMMHRSTWATSPNQEYILAAWIRRVTFEYILSLAVISSYSSEIFDSQEAWKQAVGNSPVRLQWDPDYSPVDGKLNRRTIQLGLRGDILRAYAQKGWIVHLEDITGWVRQQHPVAKARQYDQLLVPRERVYPIQDMALVKRLLLSPIN